MVVVVSPLAVVAVSAVAAVAAAVVVVAVSAVAAVAAVAAAVVVGGFEIRNPSASNNMQRVASKMEIDNSSKIVYILNRDIIAL